VEGVADFAAEGFAEQVAFAELAEAFGGGAGVGGEAVELEGVVLEGAADVADELASALVEGVGESQEAGDPPDAGAVFGVEASVVGVLEAWEGFAVIPGGGGDEAAPAGIVGQLVGGHDQLGRAFVVCFGAVDFADVVEQCGDVEDAAFVVAEAVSVGELVEEGQGESGDVFDVGQVGVAASGEASGGGEGVGAAGLSRGEGGQAGAGADHRVAFHGSAIGWGLFSVAATLLAVDLY
jgi:hypothetical protein